MEAMTAYRYAVRDNAGHQVLTHAMTVDKVSDVVALREPTPRGDRITLTNAGTPIVIVHIDPQLGPLTLWRYDLDGSTDPVTHPVQDAPSGTVSTDTSTTA